MKQTAKRTLTLIGAAALIVGAGGVAFAHGFTPGYASGWGGHHGMMGGPGGVYGPGGGRGMARGGFSAAYADRQLSELRSTLNLTSDQESAWNRYADAVKARAEVMQTHHQQMFGAGPLSSEQHLAFHQQGLDQMRQVTAAHQELYRVLTPSQRAAADSFTGWPCALR